ncbi:MAG TPA: Ppx/GppA family phosphatase [Tenuifilaceae bacterium]|mgnify:CR=1 FL=1|nr:Ppx/GppA family phosphatase [Tenuifilaceae bacterium]HRX31499.1 Ppx/GppA family phosphatase [Tenuifilaceae bacterium]
MKILKFAAIDIGSNAVRLLLSNVVEDGNDVSFSKSSLVRMPLRLGEDAFSIGSISTRRIDKLVKIIGAYRNLIEVEDVVSYKACATSAMREASNAAEVVELVKQKTGVDIEIINGQREAEIIYLNGIDEIKHEHGVFMYVDVGGGSTEVTLFRNFNIETSHSFNIGTIRMLKGKVTKDNFKELKHWIKALDIDSLNPKIIGSGGNINKLYKFSKKKDSPTLLRNELKSIYRQIKGYSYEDRIKILKMNPDRADVVIPASKIFLKIMKWSGANEVIVPTIGVSDGIIRMLYNDYKGETRLVD